VFTIFISLSIIVINYKSYSCLLTIIESHYHKVPILFDFRVYIGIPIIPLFYFSCLQGYLIGQFTNLRHSHFNHYI